MAYAIDLSKRQSARTLEQAIRHRAEVILETRVWPDAEPIVCRLEETPKPGQGKTATPKTLVLSYSPAPGDPRATGPDDPHTPEELAERYAQLVGTYCDLFIRLGDHVYLCSGDVTRVEQPSADRRDIRFHLSRPETIQVAQRRRFRRIAVADSSKVRLSWARDDRSTNEGIAWLCNVSANGIACRADAHVVDRLWIGDRLRVEFTLTPTDPEQLVLEAVVCNKTPAGTAGKMIIGMQFLTGPEYEASTRAAESLRRRLWSSNLLASQTRDPEGL